MAAVAWLRDQIFQDGVTLPAMVQVRFKFPVAPMFGIDMY